MLINPDIAVSNAEESDTDGRIKVLGGIPSAGGKIESKDSKLSIDIISFLE